MMTFASLLTLTLSCCNGTIELKLQKHFLVSFGLFGGPALSFLARPFKDSLTRNKNKFEITKCPFLRRPGNSSLKFRSLSDLAMEGLGPTIYHRDKNQGVKFIPAAIILIIIMVTIVIIRSVQFI